MPVQVMTKTSSDSDSGARIPRIEWQTKSAKLMRNNRVQEGDAWVTKKIDITLLSSLDKDGEEVLSKPAMLFDFASGANCWVRFTPTYDEIVVGIDQALPPKPPVYRDEAGNVVKDQWGKPTEHAQVLRVPVYSPRVFGEEQALHELSAKGDSVVRAIADLFEKVEAAPEYLQDKLPLIQWSGSEAKGKKGDLFAPTFKILGWHPRPAGMPLDPKGSDAAEPAAPAAAPAAKPRELVLSDEIPF